MNKTIRFSSLFLMLDFIQSGPSITIPIENIIPPDSCDDIDKCDFFKNIIKPELKRSKKQNGYPNGFNSNYSGGLNCNNPMGFNSNGSNCNNPMGFNSNGSNCNNPMGFNSNGSNCNNPMGFNSNGSNCNNPMGFNSSYSSGYSGGSNCSNPTGFNSNGYSNGFNNNYNCRNPYDLMRNSPYNCSSYDYRQFENPNSFYNPYKNFYNDFIQPPKDFTKDKPKQYMKYPVYMNTSMAQGIPNYCNVPMSSQLYCNNNQVSPMMSQSVMMSQPTMLPQPAMMSQPIMLPQPAVSSLPFQNYQQTNHHKKKKKSKKNRVKISCDCKLLPTGLEDCRCDNESKLK